MVAVWSYIRRLHWFCQPPGFWLHLDALWLIGKGLLMKRLRVTPEMAMTTYWQIRLTSCTCKLPQPKVTLDLCLGFIGSGFIRNVLPRLPSNQKYNTVRHLSKLWALYCYRHIPVGRVCILVSFSWLLFNLPMRVGRTGWQNKPEILISTFLQQSKLPSFRTRIIYLQLVT